MSNLYSSQNVAEKIKCVAKTNGIQLKVMLEEIGLSKNALSSMLSGGSMPKAENLAKIADYLGCSVDYLLGRAEQEKSPGLKPEHEEIIRCYEKADLETKGYIKGILGVQPAIAIAKDSKISEEEKQFMADALEFYRQEKAEGSVISPAKELGGVG